MSDSLRIERTDIKPTGNWGSAGGWCRLGSRSGSEVLCRLKVAPGHGVLRACWMWGDVAGLRVGFVDQGSCGLGQVAGLGFAAARAAERVVPTGAHVATLPSSPDFTVVASCLPVSRGTPFLCVLGSTECPVEGRPFLSAVLCSPHKTETLCPFSSQTQESLFEPCSGIVCFPVLYLLVEGHLVERRRESL